MVADCSLPLLLLLPLLYYLPRPEPYGIPSAPPAGQPHAGGRAAAAETRAGADVERCLAPGGVSRHADVNASAVPVRYRKNTVLAFFVFRAARNVCVPRTQ